MAPTTMTRRALNRATLDRQLLLRRWDMPAIEAIERLAGMQAQMPQSWYIGLWSRLAGFDAAEAVDLLTSRAIVRIAAMRSTIHLLSGPDALAWRPLTQPAIDRSTNGAFGKHLVGLDYDEFVRVARELVESTPRTFSELRTLLSQRWPDRDAASLAQAARARLALVQVPPRAVWGASGQVVVTTIESWLGRPVPERPSIDDMVLRCLAALGPATVRDVQAWCGLTRLREVLDRLRPDLVTFTDPDGRELFDLPDAPRPDPDTPAPARLLYDFDNLLLSHADRTRVITNDYLRQEFDADGFMPCVILVDGVTAGMWKLHQVRRSAVLEITPFTAFTPVDVEQITAEGQSLLSFAAPRATERDIRFLPRS